MRGGLSGVAARRRQWGADAFAEGARTNLMIFFSFAFIPSPRARSLSLFLLLARSLTLSRSPRSSYTRSPSPARSAPLSRGCCRLLPVDSRPAEGTPRRRRWRESARGANSGYKRRRGARSAAAAERVGGPGRVGRACGGQGDPLSLIKLYEYAILLSRFLPPSSLLLVMFLSCL